MYEIHGDAYNESDVTSSILAAYNKESWNIECNKSKDLQIRELKFEENKVHYVIFISSSYYNILRQ